MNGSFVVIAVISVFRLETPSWSKPAINKILKSVGETTEPPAILTARGPPGGDDYIEEPLSDEVDEQSIADFEFNQCVSW